MTDGAIDALYCYRPDYREVKANVAADTLPCQSLRKTFAPSRFRASLSRLRALLSGFHSFEPHPFGSEFFLNPVLTAPDPRLRNTRPAIVTSALRHVLNRVSRRPYKANVGGIRLSLQGP